MPTGSANRKLYLLKKRRFRADTWPFVLPTLCLLFSLTWTTWDQWHPSTAGLLSTLSVWSPVRSHTTCGNIRWIFDIIRTLPRGVPGVYPLDSLPVDLVQPLLHSSNLALLVFASWALAAIILAVSYLMPHWNCSYRKWALFDEAESLEQSSTILILAPGRKGLFCPIVPGFRFNEKSNVIPAKVINYLKKPYNVVNASEINSIEYGKMRKRILKFKTMGKSAALPVALLPPQYYMSESVQFYHDKLEGGGHHSRDITNLLNVYGKNEQNIPVPSFLELFGEHSKAPLFVFQVFCMLLWLIDEYWQYSLFTLFILVVFEGQIVHRRRSDLNMIKGMHMPPIPVACLRNGKWFVLSSADLVPQDVFSLASNSDLKSYPVYSGSTKPSFRYCSEAQALMCPCDALILNGSAVVNEAMLTGESLPQLKSEIDKYQSGVLDVIEKNKTAVLFAGTTILLETPGNDDSISRAAPGAILICLRTGFQTTQGKLIRTVLHSSERKNEASKEAMWFLLILTVVAVAASIYVLRHSWGLPYRDHFKLLIHCVMIITSVVPPELPVTMSMTVTMALTGLFKKKLYCTEPFRIPMAGQITTCCFDKTGTLTLAEAQLDAVLAAYGTSHEVLVDMMDETSFDLKTASEVSKLPELAESVMAACHSLISVPRKRQLPLSMTLTKGSEREIQILGNPLESQALKLTDWIPALGSTTHLVNKSHPGKSAKILHRRLFSSQAKMMTVVCRFSTLESGDNDVVLCKGAPEKIQSLLVFIPPWLSAVTEKLTLQGKRVLAMAGRTLLTDEDIHSDALMTNLIFCGLLVYGCPIKDKTDETLVSLREAGHKLVMITGDDPRTAAHVAFQTRLTIKQEIYFVKKLEVSGIVVSPCGGGNEEVISEREWFENKALCLTSIDINGLAPNLAKWVIPRTEIFARVSPKDKEMIIKCLNENGQKTLMCGDGTNDVGALKAADVGISLLNFDIEKIKDNKKKQLAAIEKHGHVRVPIEESRSQRLKLGLTATQISHLEKLERILDTQIIGLSVFGNAVKEKFIVMTRKNIANVEENYAQENLAKAAGHQKSGDKEYQATLEDEGLPTLKPGDASMAAPFTYRGQNIKCVKYLVRSGKGTLATVMMMYKFMALNSLTTGFSLSVLTLNGIKFADTQATAESLFISVLFMAASNARCAKNITNDRVIDSLFDHYFYSSIILQTCLHMGTVGIGWWVAAMHTRAVGGMDGPFQPNLVNTVIWLISAGQHAATFTANYEGAPFLISMRENKILRNGLIIYFAILMTLTSESLPILNSALKLVPFPSFAFRWFMVCLISLDIMTTTAIGRFCTYKGRINMQKLLLTNAI